MSTGGFPSRPQLISMPSLASSASSDLALDDQPEAASTSSSGWPSPSPATTDRFPPAGSRDGLRLWSAVEEAKESLRDASGPEAERALSAGSARGEHGDPAPKRWRASAGLENGVESIDLARELDGNDDMAEQAQGCDFGAIGPDADDVSCAMAAFSSSPSTPDVTEGGDACAFAGGPGSPIFVAEDAVAESGLFPLGRPISSIFFCRDDQDDLVPPCFFPGQTIPTLVVLELPRYTCLPHRLSPALNISLVGTLRYLPAVVGDDMVDEDDDEDEWAERVLINVGVGLEDGLDLWQKDATVAWERLSERRKKGRSNPAVALPGGKYTLPLTVQVPSNPTLPPTFDLPTSPFEIAYHLSVTLTVDDPTYESVGPEDLAPRLVLSQSVRSFALLPMTLPTVAPDLAPVTGLLEAPSRRRESFTAMVGSASAGWLDRFNTAIDPLKVGFGVSTPRVAASALNGASSTGTAHDAWPTSWSIEPSLPTTTFSPSSVIPVDFALRPPSALPSALLPAGQVIIRAALVRREYLHTSHGVPPVSDPDAGLLSEEEIVSCIGRHDLARIYGVHPSLPRLSLPLGFGAGYAWANGFSTSISVSPGPSSSRTHVHCASRFYLSLQVAFAPAGSCTSPPTHGYVLNDLAGFIPPELTTRTILVPISIGSVGEPPGANRRAWRELYLGRNDSTGEEVPQLIDGCAIDRDEGWILPPPSYEAALAEPEYAL